LTFIYHWFSNNFVIYALFSLGVAEMNPTNEISNASRSRPLAVPISLLLISLFSGVFFIFLIYEFPHASKLGGVLFIVILMICGITCIYSLMLAIRGLRNK
jgi:hypothetical protein